MDLTAYRPHGMIQVNQDGTFEISKVRPGTYSLNIPGATLAQPVSVVVSDRDITDVEAVLLWTRQVSVRSVVDGGGGPQPRVILTFSPFKGGVPAPSAPLSNATSTAVLNGTVSSPLLRQRCSNWCR